MKQPVTGGASRPRLDELRARVDEIDREILGLITSRQRLAKEIGNEKRALGHEVVDLAREQEVIERLAALARPPLSPRTLKAIYREIISAARSVQEPVSVCYLGPEGSFCHEAAASLFGHAAELVPEAGVQDIFSMVERDLCSMGMVPIENSYQGSVGITLDLFYEYDLKIQGETYLRIRQHLLSKEGALDRVHTIYSHPMALSQCRKWLGEHMPGVQNRETSSTSEAARLAAKNRGVAAIGSEMAAQVYHLKTLAKGIEGDPHNVTRFVVIGKTRVKKGVRNKTSVLFTLPHKAGALSKAISPLAERGINMARIESRPAKGKRWEYLFFVDVEGHQEEPEVARALKEMEQACSYFKDLGSYPAGGEPWE